MLFNTPIFFLFFIVFFLFYGFVFLQKKPRLCLIIVSSLVFYGAWNYKFIPLLVGSAVADYFIALAIVANPNRKKALLALSITLNLGILGVFKYADFALNSVAELLSAFGYQASLPTLSWVLPVGISFYTFQSMSYTIDVYRGEMEPRKGFLAFISALSFFPQLVAGPILRARQILPQFHNLPVPTWQNAKHAFVLITVGLLKKTAADLLAIPAATAFDRTDSVSLIESWTGVLAFAGQIYGDFSGYSDMAIGIALLLGFQIPLNFRLPYFAVSPIDFWRRWHISLSTWLRDYLYLPLGGNRKHHNRNIFLTMLLGGLWHGAAWNFVVWGVYHGFLLVVAHALRGMTRNQSKSRLLTMTKWACTFYLVVLGWVFFRAPGIDSALALLADLHLFHQLPAPGEAADAILILTVIGLVLMHLMDLCVFKWAEIIETKSWLLWPLIVIGQTLCLLIGEPSNEFIYFQF